MLVRAAGVEPGTSCLAGSSNGVATGWTLGAGLEFLILQNVTFKAEYMYVSLGGNSLTETALDIPFGGGSTLPSSFNANFERSNFNIARVGLNYKFQVSRYPDLRPYRADLACARTSDGVPP